MIAFLRGRILRRLDQMLVVECGGVGYEVHLPGFIRDALRDNPPGAGEPVELHISYHVSANQPRPLLVGFLREAEQEFFERFITVDGLGPTKAMKAIIHPVETIADAIERKDINFLRRLPGIGDRFDRMNDRFHGFCRAKAVHGDKSLEELLLHFSQESDEERPGLVGRHMVGDMQLDGFPRARCGVAKRIPDESRKMDLVSDPAALDHEHLVKPPQDAAPQKSDHAEPLTRAVRASGSPRRESAVNATASASATWVPGSSASTSR